MLPSRENPVIFYKPQLRTQRKNKGKWFFEVAKFKGYSFFSGRKIPDYSITQVGYFETKNDADKARDKLMKVE